MKVLIIEDEHPAARHLVRLLSRYDQDIEVLATIPSVSEAVRWFESNDSPDLIFLDIQLADGISFRIIEQVNITAPIIFTTAYDQYALKAFKVNSIDYLLKPVDMDDLKKAFEKLQLLRSSSAVQPISAEQVREAWQMLNRPYKTRFVIRIGDRLKTAPVDEIQCFYSKNKMTYLVNSEGRSYPTDYSLGEIEGLVDPARFFRISRKYMVNADAISEVLTFSSSRLKIRLAGFPSEDIIVSRERVNDFKQWLDQ